MRTCPNGPLLEAKKLVKEAIAANGNRIDAIFASNDRLAGAAAEALEELHVTNHAVITGMDAELAAIKRILAGTQDATIYMDLRELAYAAVDEAYNLPRRKRSTSILNWATTVAIKSTRS